MTRRAGQLRVGTSGYQYDHWKGPFYPRDLTRARWFAHYARRFDTVEINNTFYRLPGPETFDRWRAQAPARFLYALKFSRYATHLKRLQDPEDTIERFLAGARRLRRTLGPILVQLPPRFTVDPDRLARFLEATPRRHRWALEVRDPSWLRQEVFDLLAAHDAALCIHDLLDDHPWITTASWIYLRFHGSGGAKYGGSYSPKALAGQARRIRRELARGLDVYAYFNNDARAHAVANAADLRRRVIGAAGARRASSARGRISVMSSVTRARLSDTT